MEALRKQINTLDDVTAERGTNSLYERPGYDTTLYLV